MEWKKKEQAVKKTQNEAEKAESAVERARAKDTRNTNAEMARMARVGRRLFTSSLFRLLRRNLYSKSATATFCCYPTTNAKQFCQKGLNGPRLRVPAVE
jgi:hypothetical protein